MAGRQSHGGAPSRKPKAKVNSKKRTLDAFAIASHQVSDNIKIRHNRLGETEGGNRSGKRARGGDDEDSEGEEESHSKKQRKGPAKGRFDELDLDEGSDSEGNNWKLGQVDSDDDSDLDSDEAFGESDEEKFDGFAFSGSSDKKSKKTSSSRRKDVNLDEDEEESGSEMDDDSLGEDAIDLAAMLDATEGDSEEETTKHKERDGHESESAAEDEDEDEEDEDEEDESEESDDESSVSSADEDETLDPAKRAALQNLIASFPQADQLNANAKQRRDGTSRYDAPLGRSNTKLTLENLGSMIDPSLKKSLKSAPSAEKGESKKKAKTTEVPLAKRQQDRLDRGAAYDKTKETLERWTDTVKHNRRADHLIFPLPDNDLASAQANTRLQPTTHTKPFNELETAIQTIMEESGLGTANGKDDEDHIREFEELETNKMSIEEVKARRDQLRMARDLLFREEAKAKRIKKIKSKSYRKVHRKQREKEERLNKEALAEGGFVPSEDELEAQDRRRATERMGAKHRGSKWAKDTKAVGRAAWDEDARDGITEMARRDEELRKRVEGHAVRKEFDGESEASFSDSDDEVSEEDDDAEQRRILRQLNKIGDADLVDESAPGSKLANMKFMRTAEAARKKDNDAMVEDIRKELAGEESSSEQEDGDVGRRIFGRASNKSQDKKTISKRNEFEEAVNSDDDGADSDLEIRGLDDAPKGNVTMPRNQKSNVSSKALVLPSLRDNRPETPSEGGAWSKVAVKSDLTTDAEARKRRHKKNNAVEVEELDLSKAAIIATQPKPKTKTKNKPTTLDVGSEEDSDDENAVRLPFAIRDQELIKRAFAGADVVGEFEDEKKQTVEDEEEKVIDNTLPGWGSWTGEGLSKKAKARNKGRFMTKSEGIKEKNRKDAKLERVIINEKRVKKNGKYLASNLPHPFESRQQYERSLRLPVGPEWATKETFQDATKPRVLIKQGIIAPMSKPLL